ncbi:MAG: hypothetical protein HYW50_02645 [Candidatus Diapherotrites archaeon]|nr:hypothetical protein [Candidatus Diapherotrites archaeon]
MQKHETFKEPIKSSFDGTIIDLETIGNFSNQFNDSRRYKNIEITTFGFITKDGLSILFAKEPKNLAGLNKEISSLIDFLPRPFFAFNASFEMGVLFYNLQKKILFERELNKEQFEKKKLAIAALGIQDYDDPFEDEGLHCISAWHNGEIHKIIAHNRADLLKEKDILLKRGSRKAEEMEFKTKFFK